MPGRFTYRCNNRYPHAPHLFDMRAGSQSERVEQCRGIEDDGGCFAVLYHGPGHQSTSRCELRGNHDGKHCTHYWPGGGYDTRAFWSGDEGHTGVFDEPDTDD